MLEKFPTLEWPFLGGGWLLKKKQPLAVLHDKGGNGRCPLWFLKNKPEYSLIKARIKVIHVRETIRVCWGVLFFHLLTVHLKYV